jgi:hypothetical protein
MTQQQLAEQVGSVSIQFANGSATGAEEQTAHDGSQDFDSSVQSAVELGSVISTASFDDYLADSGERYTVAIQEGSYVRESETSGYEDVAIDTDPVTTTIVDDSGTAENDPNRLDDESDDDDHAEPDHEQVVIRLVACDSEGQPIVDSEGHYTFANEVAEGSAASYMALAFEPGSTEFTTQTVLEKQRAR